MSNVLIRDVPSDDLEQIRSAAAERGTSLQTYLLEAVHAQAAYVRRQDALSKAARRLQGRPEVTEEERAAVLEAIEPHMRSAPPSSATGHRGDCGRVAGHRCGRRLRAAGSRSSRGIRR